MKIIKSNHYGGNATNVVLKDENNKIVVVFEDKSTVLGNKIAVYDGDGNAIYFLDEDISQVHDAINIQKDADTIASVTRDDSLVHRIINIKSRGKDYTFSILNKVLHKDGKKIAKLTMITKENAFKIELHTQEDVEFISTLLYAIHMLLLE